MENDKCREAFQETFDIRWHDGLLTDELWIGFKAGMERRQEAKPLTNGSDCEVCGGTGHVEGEHWAKPCSGCAGFNYVVINQDGSRWATFKPAKAIHAALPPGQSKRKVHE